MWRNTTRLVLALLIGFLVYRIVLATQPSDQRVANTCEPGSHSVEFDVVTGLPVLPHCTFLYPFEGVSRAEAHWLFSSLVGLGSTAFVVALIWWYRRRRVNAARLGHIGASLALVVSLLGCASFAPHGEEVPLPTEPGAKLTGGGVLMNEVIDVAADPETGTPIIWRNDSQMRWPDGFTAWRVGPEVEVLDTYGNRVLITGRRYKFHSSTWIGFWVISDVDECPDCDLGSHLE